MPNARSTDESFLGSFASTTELTTRYPAATHSGMQATVTSNGLESTYICNGATWDAVTVASVNPTAIYASWGYDTVALCSKTQ